MLGAPVDHESIRAGLKNVDRTRGRVWLAEVQLGRAAIGAVAADPGASADRISAQMSGQRPAVAGKFKLGCPGPAHDQAALFLLAGRSDLPLRLLVFMKSITSGRMLSRQLRPAKMP